MRFRYTDKNAQTQDIEAVTLVGINDDGTVTVDADGNPVINMQLSSVAAGASIPQGQELIDNDGTYIYEGFAPYGTATSAASWSIIRSTLSAGGISAVERADGDSLANNVWDDRASLSYS